MPSTSSRASTLARYATVTLSYGRVKEACPLGLAPSASTTAMLALGDALFLSVMKLRDFTAEVVALLTKQASAPQTAEVA